MAMGEADALLEQLWNAGGTDMLLTPGVAPMIRIDGELTRVEGMPLQTGEENSRLLEQLLTPQQLRVFATVQEVDFSFTWREQARLRGNAFHSKGLPALSLRLIPHAI